MPTSIRTIYNLSRPKTLLWPCALIPQVTLAAGSDSLLSERADPSIILNGLFLLCGALLIGLLIGLRKQGGFKQKIAALEKGQTNFHQMSENLPNITIFKLTCSPEKEFKFNALSKGYERVLGIERDRVLKDAKLAFDPIYEADIPILQQALRQAEVELTPADLKIRVLDLGGNLKWLHVNAVPYLENGSLIWDGFMLDISASKNIESALLEEKRNFQNLFDTIDDCLLICDMNGNLLHANPSVEQRLGYGQEELESMSFFELYPEPVRAEAYQVIALMQSEQSTTCGLPLQNKNGQTVQVDMNIFQGSWKNRQAIFGVARDIAGRQQTETALRESRQMLQLIMDTIPMAVFWKDQDSVYLGCNQTFIEECGLHDVGEVIGKTPFDLFDKKQASSLLARNDQVISSNQPLFNVLSSTTRSDGSMAWRESNIIPLHDDDGHAVGVLGVWRDVTEERLAEERLKRTLEDMERFNQLMRGRERRTLELKSEINQLLEELGRQIKYKTTLDKPS
jgi:PAS domain S-box-containing protein